MQTAKERMLALVKPNENGCWIWNGYKNQKGYGRIWNNDKRKPVQTHRLSWEIFVGKIPPGSLVCHICDMPACCNPEHLFLGTAKDNMLDAKSKNRLRKGNQHTGKTHCIRGHELSGENLAIWKNHRICKQCRRLRYAEKVLAAG